MEREKIRLLSLYFLPIFMAWTCITHAMSDEEFFAAAEQPVKVEEVKAPAATAGGPAAEFGLEFTFPLIGAIKLIPFTDPTKTPVELGFKAKFADASRKLDLGLLVIDDGEIKKIGDTLSLTGLAHLFDHEARIGLKNIIFGGKNEPVKKLVIGFQFTENPSLELIPGMVATLTDADVELERGKPAALVATIQLFGKSMRLALALNKEVVNAFIELPVTSLAALIPAVADMPPLNTAQIKTARLDITNLWHKKVAGAQTPKLQAMLNGYVDFPPQAFAQNLVSSVPPLPPEQQVAVPNIKVEEPISFEELLDVVDTEVTDTQAPPALKPPAEEPGHSYFELKASFDYTGVQATLETKKLDIPSLGIIDAATITIDTVKKPATAMLTGNLTFNVTDVGTIPIAISSTITSKGIVFAGSVEKEFSYAGIEFKKLAASFDTQRKSAELIGAIFLPVVSNISLEARLLLGSDPDNAQQKLIKFRTTVTTAEFKPFQGIPVLETFYIKNFDAGIELIKSGGKTKKGIYLNGDFYVMGLPLKSILKFVENEKGDKGAYVNAPLTKDKKLSDFFPELKGPVFDGIFFNEAMFVASTLDYVEINPDTKARTEIPKGLSFLATVPLKGTLEPVGKFLGSTDQTFSMYGSLKPENISLSQLGFLLSKGYPEPDKAVSMGETKVLVSGKPSFGVKTEIIFRPDPKEELKFSGAFDFTPTEVEINAEMVGAWTNPFGFPKSSISNLVLGVGMTYGSPGVPTKLKGGGALKIGDFAAKVYFSADAAIKDVAVKGEITETMTLSSLMAKILKAAFELDIPLQIPELQLKDLIVEMAAQDIMIGQELIRQGLVFKATVPLPFLNANAYVDIMVRPPSFGGGGLKIFGAVDPINIANVIKITKSGQEYGGRCFVPKNIPVCGVFDKAEVTKAGEEFAKGKDTSDKARIDIEVTPQRQNFLISGAVTLADIFSADTCMSIDRSGFNFMLEAGMKLNGEIIMWQGMPLFLARIVAQSSGGLSNPQIALNIDFMQNLQQYVKDKADEAFKAAQNQVVDGINTAQREIDKINAVEEEAHRKIKEAEEKVAGAHKDLDAITRAQDEAKAALNNAQQDVNSIQQKIDDLNAWYNALPDY